MQRHVSYLETIALPTERKMPMWRKVADYLHRRTTASNEDTYLCGAADIADLERRMRECQDRHYRVA